ncbi:MAG: PEP-CTERM sorting domain-containing protein [Verrucomicrobiales bacterium]
MNFHSVLKGLSTLTLLTFSAQAATVVTGSSATASGSYNLTDLGSSDWAYWSTTANNSHSGAALNSKSGASLIGDLTAIGGNPAGTGNTLRGSSASNVVNTFSWTGDGFSPASGSNGTVRGIFNTTLDATDAGVRLTVTLTDAATYSLNLWTLVFDGTSTLTVSDDGGSSTLFTSSGESFGTGNPKGSHLHTLTVTTDTPGTTLTIDNILTVNGNLNGSSHAGFSGAAISVIPEPSAMILTSIGALLVFRRKR